MARFRTFFFTLFFITSVGTSQLQGNHTAPIQLNKAQRVSPQKPTDTPSITKADISCAVFDLKYNKEQGVKICEIQGISGSKTVGYDFLNNGKGLIAERMNVFLSQYFGLFWFSENATHDPVVKQKLLELGWNSTNKLSDLAQKKYFQEAALSSVENPYCLSDYNGFLYTSIYNHYLSNEFSIQYPGIIVMDSGMYKYYNDKSVMNNLLLSDPATRGLKPICGVYPKLYTDKLAQQITNEIPGDIFVIKPKIGARGNGVIIVNKAELDSALKYILTTKSKKLKKNSDLTYSYWGFDRQKEFIVEEFIISDPVLVPHLGNKEYNGTMRVITMLRYDCGVADLVVLGAYWKLPKKALSQVGSLVEKHRSCGEVPFYAKVDPEILDEVEEQLNSTFPILYQKVIGALPPEGG